MTADGVTVLELESPHGLARAHVRAAEEPVGALVLGHGAGGTVAARDLLAATKAAQAERFSVALVEQPYLVAGRRSAPRAPLLDAAWTAVIEQLVAGPFGELPLVTGGRSAGARVACRTAADTGAAAVLCLAFPLRPPTRQGAEPKTRLPELDAVAVPTLVVQGSSDRFGVPPAGPNRVVAELPGDHRLTTDLDGVEAAVRGWLPGVLGRAPAR